MSVFRRTRKGQNGGKIVAGKYTIEFKDAAGIVRRIGGFRDKKASEELERGILRLVALRAAGSPPDAEGARFLESVPAAVRDALAAWDVINQVKATGGKSLDSLIAAWERHMESRELSERRCREAATRVRRLFSSCRFRVWSDIDAAKVECGLAGWRHDKDMSAATSNSYLSSAKAFCSYLVKAGLADRNPLARLANVNEAADPRIERRPFTPEELSRLLAATEKAEHRFGMDGWERGLLYAFAAESGIRWSELHGLKKKDFDFAENTVTTRASVSKNSQTATLPLRPETAKRLLEYMRDLPQDEAAFPRLWKGHGAKMIHADMADTGIPVYDEYGRKADFHCLRTSTGTLLSSAGVPLATVQKMMRHSTPILTAKHYIRLSIVDKAAALSKMPDFHPAGPDAEDMRATGTDGEMVDRKFDSNRDEKGLFSAVNCYKLHEVTNMIIDGLKTNKPLENQGVKNGAGEEIQ